MIKTVSWRVLRKRRVNFVVCVVLFFVVTQFGPALFADVEPTNEQPNVLSQTDLDPSIETARAADVLSNIPTKGRAPKTGYTRSEFSDGWANVGSCDMRNIILQRDLQEAQLGSDECVVVRGTLHDPYTNKVVAFVRGSDTSDDVQIDHVVALSDAWQKGAQRLSAQDRFAFANDPLNLLAVDGDANQQKGDSDAASWLPDKTYRCRYVARQIAVKKKYNLWVTSAEHDAMLRTLNSCPDQPLPVEVVQ